MAQGIALSSARRIPMKSRFAAYAAFIAMSAAATVTAQAASRSDPAQDQRENVITRQLNQQQLQGYAGSGYGTGTYQGTPQTSQGWTQEQMAQPPSDEENLSFIE
jgi:hypothetical protein